MSADASAKGKRLRIEKNSNEVARVIANWLDKAVPEKTAAR